MDANGDRRSAEDARVEIARNDADALDVRDEEQFLKGHVIGAIHLPREHLDSRLDELDREKRLVVFAEDDKAAEEAAETLREAGFETAVAKGGMDAWTSAGFNTQPTMDPAEDTKLGKAQA